MQKNKTIILGDGLHTIEPRPTTTQFKWSCRYYGHFIVATLFPF